MLHKIGKNKKCAPKLIFSNQNFFYKYSDDFWRWKPTLKIRFWHFLMAIFGHLTSLMKKSNPVLWSVQSYLQSEMFLSNSVDMMKNLPGGPGGVKVVELFSFEKYFSCFFDVGATWWKNLLSSNWCLMSLLLFYMHKKWYYQFA